MIGRRQTIGDGDAEDLERHNAGIPDIGGNAAT